MIRILLSKKLGELRWTQADLARKTGIRPATINAMYNEIVDRVNLEHLDLICEALHCNLSDIMIYVPNKIPIINRTRAGKEIE
jgi:putative transcriptional regulator